MQPGFSTSVASCILQFVQGDITRIAVDAIVNAANSQLAGGGGVDGAIHRAGGEEIMLELDRIRGRIGRCDPGSAVATGAGRLPAKYVFHAVGPRYCDGKHNEASLLRSCYTTCLDMALDREVKTISFPSISTGVYGYPIEEAAAIAVHGVADWLLAHPQSLSTVTLVQFSARDCEIYVRHAQNAAARAAESEKIAGNGSALPAKM